MSKLAFETEVITGNKSNICSCGRKIMRAEDIAKGICRTCNPFAEQRSTIFVSSVSERNENALRDLDYYLEKRDSISFK